MNVVQSAFFLELNERSGPPMKSKASALGLMNKSKQYFSTPQGAAAVS